VTKNFKTNHRVSSFVSIYLNAQAVQEQVIQNFRWVVMFF